MATRKPYIKTLPDIPPQMIRDPDGMWRVAIDYADLCQDKNFSQHDIRQICKKVLNNIKSGKSLEDACRGTLADPWTVSLWLNSTPQSSKTLDMALAERSWKLAEECVTISDELEADPACRKVRVDTRKWLASKINPNVFGERSKHEISGPDGKPITMQGATVVMTPEQYADFINKRPDLAKVDF